MPYLFATLVILCGFSLVYAEEQEEPMEQLEKQFTKASEAVGVEELVNKTGEEPSQAIETGEQPPFGGGCLIATATYGTELAPQVQMLREIRNNMILQTNSGKSFMEYFNQFYYTFSPTIADWERENPVFKESVKLTIIPLITSLSILNYVDIDSEETILGYGIGIILLNLGMYFIAPGVAIIKLKKRFH